MSLQAGTRLGPYEIVSPIGAGGMGEVYRARDTRLERIVAVKVLPERLSASPESRQRFEREAKTISQLSHPHICALHDVGREGDVSYLVMEYLEGETLGERLASGPLPLEQVLRYGREIADALDKAHRQGIVHRDLKPANVMLTKSGVKLLDFGLAKAMAPPSQQSSLTSLPTQQGLTQEGTILGTFQYMAPEQLEGKEADARTDIFAFGALLYEMATGRKAFAGASQASLISQIMTADPPSISSLQPLSPAALDRVVKKSLAKDPEARWQSAADLGSELQWIAEGSQAGVAAPAVRSRKRRERLFTGIAIALAAGAVAAAVTWAMARRGTESQRLVTRLAAPIPSGDILVRGHMSDLAVSPDGRHLVYATRRGDKHQLVLRSLDSADASPLPGTEDASTPFFSPDGQWVGFLADGKIQKVALSGGVATVCAAGSDLYGATWGPDDTIVFPPAWARGLSRVPASGGTPRALTTVSAEGENRGHLWPEFLPGGKALLFTIFTGGSLGEFQVAALDLATGKSKILVHGATSGRYSPSGHLLYVREGRLLAAPFDPVRLTITGPAFQVLQDVYENTNGGADFAVSRSGTFAYASGGLQLATRSLLWVDRAGKATPASELKRPFANPRVSPDGKRVAVAITGETYDIWVLDLERDTMTRLSFGKDDTQPVWTPDGKRIAYNSSRSGAYNLYIRAADGSGSDVRLTSDPDSDVPHSFSPDGKLLVFDRTHNGVDEIWACPLEKPSDAHVLLKGPFNYESGAVSPDGRWLAYRSNESGQYELYVTAFPVPSGKWQISTDGSDWSAVWSPAGNEIFYARRGKVLSVALTTAGTFSASRPTVLFEGDYFDGTLSPDGKRFLMVRDDLSTSAPNRVDVVLNWFEDLRTKAVAPAR